MAEGAAWPGNQGAWLVIEAPSLLSCVQIPSGPRAHATLGEGGGHYCHSAR